jgi:hypothetical protein
MSAWGRKGPGGSGDLQNRTDLPTAGWVGSIPTRSRHSPAGGRRPPPGNNADDWRLRLAADHRWWLLAAGPRLPATGWQPMAAVILLLVLAPRMGRTQQPDSARAGISRPAPAPAPPPPPTTPPDQAQPPVSAQRARPPISAKAAFLYSLALPGYGQSKLDRSYAGALFFSVEALSFAMLRQAEIDLHYAQAHVHDSTLVVLSYQTDSLGQSVRDSTGKPIPATYGYARYDSARVGARKTHVEDWIAALAFNHLISAADAFVAAELWDLPAHVHPLTGMSSDGRRQLYGMSVTW